MFSNMTGGRVMKTVLGIVSKYVNKRQWMLWKKCKECSNAIFKKSSQTRTQWSKWIHRLINAKTAKKDKLKMQQVLLNNNLRYKLRKNLGHITHFLYCIWMCLVIIVFSRVVTFADFAGTKWNSSSKCLLLTYQNTLLIRRLMSELHI